MRHRLLIALGTIIIGCGGLGLTMHSAGRAPYSIAALERAIRLHPRMWVGRRVSVRAVLTGITIPHQWFLIDPLGSVLFFATPPGGLGVTKVNIGRLSPALLLAGSRPPLTGAQAIMVRLATLPGPFRLFFEDKLMSMTEVYRIKIISTDRCPRGYGGFCPVAVLAP